MIGVNVSLELINYLKKEIARRVDQSGVKGLKQKNDFRLGIISGLYERMKESGGWRDMELRRLEVTKKHFSNIKSKNLPRHSVDKSYYEAGEEKAKEINLSRQAGYSAGGLLT